MVNVFKILWPKYMLYFLYFNNKIQKYNTSSHAVPLPGLCNVKSQCHTKYVTAQNTFQQWILFLEAEKIASKIFIRQRSDGIITGYYSVTRMNNASDINPQLMNASNLIFEEYFEKLF